MSSCVFTINVRVLFPQLEVYNSVSNDSGHKEMKRMKTGIHPNYKLSKVICSCGNTFETGSVKEDSILVVKNSLKLADVLIVSTKNTVLNKPDFLKNRQVFFLPVFSFP
jgi:ribosomal protein L31